MKFYIVIWINMNALPIYSPASPSSMLLSNSAYLSLTTSLILPFCLDLLLMVGFYYYFFVVG